MKIIIFGVFLAFSGCAAFSDATNFRIKEEAERDKQIEKMHEQVFEGSPRRTFLETWGSPRYCEKMGKIDRFYYDSYQGEPTIFTFDSGLLIGWEKDANRIKELQIERAMPPIRRSSDTYAAKGCADNYLNKALSSN